MAVVAVAMWASASAAAFLVDLTSALVTSLIDSPEPLMRSATSFAFADAAFASWVVALLAAVRALSANSHGCLPRFSAVEIGREASADAASAAVKVDGTSSPALADIDGDGDLDLVVGGGDGKLTLLLNVGTPKRPAYKKVAAADSPFGGLSVIGNAHPSFVDLDGDGDLDLMVLSLIHI